jgi:large subunit ribosomal protein L25
LARPYAHLIKQAKQGKIKEEIEMTTLKTEKRDMSVKAKRLRREGFIPGNLCGKDIEGSIPLYMPETEAQRFLKNNNKGAQVELHIGRKKYNAIVKDTQYNALLNKIMFIDFQELIAGEKIVTTAPVVLLNESMAKGSVNQELEEITYKAEPKNLIDSITIDFADFGDKRYIRVSDLEIAKNKKINLVTPLDAVIVSVSENIDVEVDNAEDSEENAAE